MATSGQTLSKSGQSAVRPPMPQDAVDRPLAAYAHDYADGHDTGRHAHARAQFLYATAGVMRVRTDTTAWVVPPGRALWMPAGTAHAVRTEGPVAMRALFFRADAAAVGPAGVSVLAITPLLRELVLAACALPLEWESAGRGGHLAALILEEVAGAPHLPLGVPEGRDPRLCRVTAGLRAAPADPRPLEDWAMPAGASARTLSRLFRQETGLPFAAWRQQLRLAEAAAMLAGGTPPARVAAAVGYASASAFGAAFRASFGHTPGERGR
ncbi:AraC family transcriptional regulator [Humitalea sp. 24SJ18S-53]|uniref:AraC family transcriptional regulator n=1 Tax=Humitalea sp. 24SJ18S-53 TaxID=3422307 RepID=UPI003D66EBCE